MFFCLMCTSFFCQAGLNKQKQEAGGTHCFQSDQKSLMFGESQSDGLGRSKISDQEIVIASLPYSAFTSPQDMDHGETSNQPQAVGVTAHSKRGKDADGGFQSATGLVEVFPNPSSGRLFLDFSTDISYKRVSLNLVALNGAVVFSEMFDFRAFEQRILEIDLSRLPSGNYLLTAQIDRLITVEPICILK